MMTEEEKKDTLKDFTHFGTDMATWKLNVNGFAIIKDGFIYGIKESQYNPNEGDITRARAEAILSWS